MSARLKPVSNQIESLPSFRHAIAHFGQNPSAELLRYMRTRPNLLTLAQGEGSLPTPDFILDAAKKAMNDGRTFYGPVLGLPELRQEIATYYNRIYNLNIPTNRLSVTASGSAAMHYALMSILEAGDDVVCVTPMWRNLLGAIELTGASRIECPMDLKDGKWVLDLEKLFSYVTKDTKAILILTPNNPTGWVAQPHEIKTILDYARDRDLWVIADEVYGRLVYDGTHAPSFLEYAQAEDRLYVVNSFSKSWAMTGWRLGWLVGPVNAEKHISDIALYEMMCPPSFSQIAAIAALRDGENFIKTNIEHWRQNRAYVVARLNQMKNIEALTPDAAFYVMLRSHVEPNCLVFAKRLIDEAGLGLAPGCGFGDAANGWLRLCFAVSREKLDEALKRFESILR